MRGVTSPLRRLALAAIPIAFLVAGCGGVKIQDVVVTRAGSGPITDHPGGLGTVSPAVSLPVSLDVRDTVTQVAVRPGDHVTQGQTLVSIDPAPLQQFVVQLQVRIQDAQAALTREQGVVAYDQQRGSPETAGAQAEVQALQAQVALEQQQLQIAQGRNPAITAPMEGDVQAVNVSPGQTVSPSTPLVILVDYTRIVVNANLPVAEESEVSQGQAAELTFPALPNLALAGKVTAISPGATNNGLTFQVSIDATNTPTKVVRPNFQAYVRVSVTRQAKVIVPKLAVLNIDQDPTVYVVEGQVAHRHHVQVGIADETHIEVLSGVNLGDVCVIVGGQSLDDGSAVRITKQEG